MKLYKAIIFDWDGTAIISRKAPADAVLALMEPLLERGVVLGVISGTSYGNIAGGGLSDRLSQKALERLYLGLDRGARNYGFVNGKPVVLQESSPDPKEKLRIDRAAFEVHARLLTQYGYPTDIVFSRVNYCKLDLQAETDRADALFFHADELERVSAALNRHGISGLGQALSLAEQVALQSGIALKATTDAKYIELGATTKSDNVDFLMSLLSERYGIAAADCAFLGDEFSYLDKDVPGSDAFMMTRSSAGADFFDVSSAALDLPAGVTPLGGSVERFMAFLREQDDLRSSAAALAEDAAANALEAQSPTAVTTPAAGTAADSAL